jgi:hypothetical protein
MTGGTRTITAFIWIGSLIILAGIALFAWFVISDTRANSWPTASGQVVATTIDSSQSSRRTSYTPKAVYTYEVAGRRYENNDIWLEESKSFRKYADAQEILGGIRVGGPVTVSYDPADPSRSRLRPSGLPWYFLVVVFAGAVFLGMGLFMRRPARPQPRTA